jgi:hypothetical protein
MRHFVPNRFQTPPRIKYFLQVSGSTSDKYNSLFYFFNRSSLFLSLFLSSSANFPHLTHLSTRHLPLALVWFQMADNGWSDGICPAEPGLPKLLLLSLERVGVVDPPEYTYREYNFRGTLRCDYDLHGKKHTLPRCGSLVHLHHRLWVLGHLPKGCPKSPATPTRGL